MKVIILAGGFGTRISEYTSSIPKPMVPIGNHPIIWHIMNIYSNFGHNNFYLALGYKANIIKEYFLNYRNLNSDFTVNLASGNIESHKTNNLNWNVTLVDTGLQTMTGGRIKRLKSFIGNEPFMLTYGDGLSNVNLEELLKFHKSHKKMVTLTAVRPTARFGDLKFNGDSVSSFEEKPQLHEGWINGGFFVCQPEIFDLIGGDDEMFEKEPLEKVVKAGELMAFKHDDFWQNMDSKRDRDFLESIYKDKAPWLIR
ncbi:glucose-1-phosphate cytidylyltransferase [Gammaproteobacteria bacterium]|nr:glucose-1-phosphate cytidylyltransferase [Gammaproteobacteria bacterium]